MRTRQQEVFESIEPGNNVLVLSPSFAKEGAEICSDFLSEYSDVCPFCITFTTSPEDHLMNWRRHGIVPERASFVKVGGSDTSSRLGDFDSDIVGPEEVETTLDQVGSVENLTKLGVRMTNRLEEIDSGIGNHQILVCFDSVTELLQYVDTEQAFKFLHVVTDQFTESGAIAHFHMDPHAHDEETINTLRTLFDDVVDIRDGASPTESS